MIGRIQYLGNTYYSYVFAHFEVFYRNQYVVYNPIDNKFEIVQIFGDNGYGHRQIGLINEHENGFISHEDITLNMGVANHVRGYAWMIEQIKNIEEGKDLPEELVSKVKEMNASIDPDKWNEVTTEDDVEDMMNHTGGFHDQYWVEIKGVSDDVDPEVNSKLQIRFTSQGPFDVLVEFEGSIYMNIGFYSCNRIFVSTVVIGKKCIYWVNDAEDGITEEEVKDYRYIAAKKLRWKFVVKQENDW